MRDPIKPPRADIWVWRDDYYIQTSDSKPDHERATPYYAQYRMTQFQRKLNEKDAEIATLKATVIDAKNQNEWAELWYFVMDEAASEFEKIVTTCSPSTWMQEAHKLMKEKK